MTALHPFTIFHTALSLVAITAGILVVKGLVESSGRQLWTLLFLCSAAATTLTGFFFPFQGVTPAFALGLISIVPITLAFVARYRHRLTGAWRGTYVISAIVTLYFNCFVLIVQAFQKLPSLNALAPTQTEPPFQIVQLVALILFVGIGVLAFKKYRVKERQDELATVYVSPRPTAE